MPPKRILLMYISEVSGHRSAAMAVEKALRQMHPDNVEVRGINAFHYTNPISEKIVNRIYMSIVTKTPQIWDFLYDNPAIIKKVEAIKKGIHKFNSPKLRALFEEYKPDIVACTQAFPCGMCADYKKAFNLNMKLVAILTDYVPHSFWIYDTVDYFISPSEDVSSRLTEKGIAPEKIKSFGIPFDPKFNDPQDKREILDKLDLKSGIPTILIMGGGQGLGPIKTVINSLEEVKEEIQEIIICGSNKELFKSLSKKTHCFKKKILVFGYSDIVHELMSISDIIITKPGGITTAEVLTKGLPMIILNPLPGQEANNTAYLIEKNAAIKVQNAEKMHEVIEDLLNNPSKLSELRESAKKISKPNASVDIARLLLEEAKIHA